jgi:hypothetical protein
LNHEEAKMRRILLAAAVGVALGAGGLSLASHGAHGEGKVTTLSERDVAETLNGKDARVTTVEVALEPGDAGRPHRHAGPVFGYVLEGEFELGLGDEPAKTLKAGKRFTSRAASCTGCRVTRATRTVPGCWP